MERLANWSYRLFCISFDSALDMVVVVIVVVNFRSRLRDKSKVKLHRNVFFSFIFFLEAGYGTVGTHIALADV